jgi:hypothetical protein
VSSNEGDLHGALGLIDNELAGSGSGVGWELTAVALVEFASASTAGDAGAAADSWSRGGRCRRLVGRLLVWYRKRRSRRIGCWPAWRPLAFLYCCPSQGRERWRLLITIRSVYAVLTF